MNLYANWGHLRSVNFGERFFFGILFRTHVERNSKKSHKMWKKEIWTRKVIIAKRKETKFMSRLGIV